MINNKQYPTSPSGSREASPSGGRLGGAFKHMKTKLILFLSLWLFVSGKTYTQCNFATIGTFETPGSGTAVVGWSLLHGNNAEYSLQSEVVHGGNSALKIWAKENNSWNIRMMHGCNLDLKKNNAYSVSFWMKGNTGASFGVALQSNHINPPYVLKEEITAIENTDWKQYTYIFHSDGDYGAGKIKLTFKSAGVYYLDDLIMIDVDCNGTPGGTAFVDDCGICAGGDTGIKPNTLCHIHRVAPDDPDIRYSGAIHAAISETAAELLRFTPAFLELQPQGKWSKTNARTQSGITISFKTNSPFIALDFSELEDSEIRDRNFAVFKNGKLLQEGIKTLSFEVINAAEDHAEWTVSLPSFSGVKFNGLKLTEGYSLSSLDEDERPVYAAIGNSITHGVGQDNGSHLTYPFLLAKSLGYQLYNLGIGGSRVTSLMAQNLNSLNPKLITVLWGYNDMMNSQPLSQMFTEYEDLLSTLMQQFPQAYICVILQTYTTTAAGTANPVNTIEALRTGQKKIVERLATTHSNLSYFDGWDSTYGAENLADVVHLSKVGAANLATALYEELKEKLQTSLPVLKKDKKADWTVFPNPAKDKIHVIINNETVERELLLFDMLGQLVHKTSLTAEEQVVDIASLKLKGVFFVTLKEQDKKNTLKLVIE